MLDGDGRHLRPGQSPRRRRIRRGLARRRYPSSQAKRLRRLHRSGRMAHRQQIHLARKTRHLRRKQRWSPRRRAANSSAQTSSAPSLAAVGVMDMLRFDKFTIGWAWKEEYGSPSEDPKNSQLSTDTRHSITSSRRQLPRHPHHHRGPRRSRLPRPQLQIRRSPSSFPGRSQSGPDSRRNRAGHGAGMPLSKRIEAIVDQFAFMAKELQVEPART